MKLSEAIRLGAMATEQGFGAPSIASNEAPCALGAARIAAGLGDHCAVDCYSVLAYRWPVLYRMVANPVAGRMEYVVDAIWSLNDVHRWTREQIADWIETIEAQHETPAPALEVAVKVEA